jgi:DNA-binding NarL/FixJ family response regulator
VSPEEALPARGRLAVAPDAPLVLAGTTVLLNRVVPELEIVCLRDVAESVGRVDVLLYDPQRHRAEEFEAQSRASAGMLLVAFSWSVRPDVVDDARREGAVAFLSKELREDELGAALRAIRAGHRNRFLVQPFSAPEPPVQTRPGGLTEREYDVIELVTQGLTNDEVAQRLFLSVNSVKSYIRSGYRKIGATRRSQAVLWGVQHGMDQRPGGRR